MNGNQLFMITLLVVNALVPSILCHEDCQTKLALFVDWLKQNEVFQESKSAFEVTYLSEEVGYGVLTKRAISPGEKYFSIPKEISMGVRSALESDIGFIFKENPELLSDNNNFGTAALMVHLVYERFYKKESSFFWPYLNLLPNEASELRTLSPLYYTEKEMEALMLSYDASIYVPQIFDEFNDRFAQLNQKIFEKYPSYFPKNGNDLKSQLKWAFVMIKARAFSPRVPPPTDSISMIPLADMLNHKEGTALLTVEGMVVNQTQESNEEGTTKKILTNYIQISKKGYKEGDELFTSYHKPSHDFRTNYLDCGIIFLLNYGFVPYDKQIHSCLSMYISIANNEDSSLLLNQTKFRILNSLQRKFRNEDLGESSTRVVVPLSSKLPETFVHLILIIRTLLLTENDLNQEDLAELEQNILHGVTINAQNEAEAIATLKNTVSNIKDTLTENYNKFTKLKSSNTDDQATMQNFRNIQLIMQGESRILTFLLEDIARLNDLNSFVNDSDVFKNKF